MAEDVLEQLVETYLASRSGFFLNPQYVIGVPGVWHGEADFLAIDFPNSQIWMVEVTKSPKKIFDKINEFEKSYAPRIRKQLLDHGVVRDDGNESAWTIGLWIFVPSEWKAHIEGKLHDAEVVIHQVTSLEDTLFPGRESSR